MRKEAIPDLEEAHRLLQPVYSCLRRAERVAREDEESSDGDAIRGVMDHLDSAKDQLEEVLRPDRP